MATRDSNRGTRRSGPRPNLSHIEQQLQHVRSVLAVAALALDEVVDPSELEQQAECDATDVAVVIRLGIEQLNQARQALDQATP